VCNELGVSQRKACRTLDQSRSSQRYELTLPVKDASVLEAIKKYVKKRPRFGYRRITVELKNDGWYINFKRVYRIWHDNDLKGPRRKGRRRHGQDGCSDNACNKKKPEYINHIWSYDFVSEKLESGRKVRMLNIVDEYTRECLTIDVARRISSQDVIDVLRYLFLVRGEPAYIRSDNGPEFTAQKVKKWLKKMDVKTLFVEPGSPWENGYIESFNSHLRDECLDREIFVGIEELRYVVDRWRLDYNHYRPHSSLGYMTPAAYAASCRASAPACQGPAPSHDGCIGSDSAPLRQPQCSENGSAILS
jgi:transposase InsO family protein